MPYEVVPGITSAIAVPAYAGIPLTLRHSSTSFTVVTGHEAPDADDQRRLGGGGQGRRHRRDSDGRRPDRRDRPAADQRWPVSRHAGGRGALGHPARATDGARHPRHDRRPGTRATVHHRGRRGAPSVASRWFESRPLFGKRVVVTRPRAAGVRAGPPAARPGGRAGRGPGDPDRRPRRRRGRAPIAAGRRPRPLRLGGGDVGQRRPALPGRACPTSAGLAGIAIAAIGPGTAAVLASGRDPTPTWCPSRYVAEGLLEDFPVAHRNARSGAAAPGRGGPGGAAGGPAGQGLGVDVVEAYRTVAGEPDADAAGAAAEADAICFTSSSTVTRYLDVAGEEAVPPVVACIGPVTADDRPGLRAWRWWWRHRRAHHPRPGRRPGRAPLSVNGPSGAGYTV